MGDAITANYDQRTLAFYGTLLGLVILDLILLAWILSPVAMPLTSAQRYQGPLMNDSVKPSPFETVKTSTPKRTPKIGNAQASLVMPTDDRLLSSAIQ